MSPSTASSQRHGRQRQHHPAKLCRGLPDVRRGRRPSDACGSSGGQVVRRDRSSRRSNRSNLARGPRPPVLGVPSRRPPSTPRGGRSSGLAPGPGPSLSRRGHRSSLRRSAGAPHGAHHDQPALGTALSSASSSPPARRRAKEYNTRRPYLPPAGQVKVNNARATCSSSRASSTDAKEAEERAPGRARCPDGVFGDRSNPRREVIIATKDIVNLGGQLDLSASCR